VRILVRALLVVALAVFGVLAWDVWQLKGLRPPADPTFEGFVRAGRRGSLRIDAAGQRLYWVAGPPRTVVPYPEPVVYEFGQTGALLNWTPGTGDFKGMILDAPVRPKGAPATEEEARGWLRPPPR
jgi:hypothetical protein